MMNSHALLDQSRRDTCLIPIKLDLELDGTSIRLRDSFTWNLHECYFTPEQVASLVASDRQFAAVLIADWDLSLYAFDLQQNQPHVTAATLGAALIPMIADAIRQQVSAFAGAVEQDEVVAMDKRIFDPAYIQQVQAERDAMPAPSLETAESSQSHLDPNGNRMDDAGAGANTGMLVDHPTVNGDVKHGEPHSLDGDQGQTQQQKDTIAALRQKSRMEASSTAGPVVSYGDIRIIIKLDVHVGALYLRDQFEWPLFEGTGARVTGAGQVSPEEFSKGLVADLGLGGEFVPLVATSIREQVVLARLNFDDAMQAPLYSRYLRDEDDSFAWEPTVRFLSEQEIAEIAREDERESRGSDALHDDREQQLPLAAPTLAPIDPIPSTIPLVVGAGEVGSAGTLASHLVQKPTTHAPIYIDNPPPLVDVDPTIFAQQVAMLRTSALAAHRSSRASSPSPFHSMGSPPSASAWRCSWCLIQGQYTPTIRRGPLGLRTVCQACGIVYEKKGILPFDRYKANPK
ncbi:Snf5- protein 1 [Kappamyces sp. JEL0680]|nr:Snf5- protein 1 [Kappamyces sp. JEL0680]